MLTKSSWRIAVLSLLLIFVVSSVNAQKYRVGGSYVKDGIPCTIIDMDADGKKGLIMTMVPKMDKEMEKAIKAGETKWFYIPKKEKGAVKKLRAEYVKEFYNQYKCDKFEVRTSGFTTPDRITTSLSGKENMKNVIEFCNAKEISMETYFPLFAWAQSLGEGWYIPGIDELQLYVKLFCYDGIGGKHAQNTIEHGKKVVAQAQAAAEAASADAEAQLADAIAQGFITEEEAAKYRSGKVSLKEAKALSKKMAASIGYDSLDYIARPEFVASSTLATTRKDDNADKGCDYLILMPIKQDLTMKSWYDMVPVSDIIKVAGVNVAAFYLQASGGYPCAVCEVEFE